jgi:hypothetical protein
MRFWNWISLVLRRPEVFWRDPPSRVVHPDVLGVQKNVYFVTHSHQEESVSSRGPDHETG